MPADAFIETCLKYIHRTQHVQFLFSLGYQTDCTDAHGYQKEDIEAMADVLLRHELSADHGTLSPTTPGVMLALNGRQLYQSMESWTNFLTQHNNIQILVWTGKGEPPISRRKIQALQEFFASHGFQDRIGFDCQVRTIYYFATKKGDWLGSPTHQTLAQVNENYWKGIGVDILVQLYGYWKRLVG